MRLNTRKFLLIAALTAGSVSPVHAQSAAIPHEVVAQAMRYVGSMGCYSEDTSDANSSDGVEPLVVKLFEGGEVDVSWEAKYLVFAASDVGCQGGTGSTFYVPVVVEGQFSSLHFHVVPEESGPLVELDLVNLSSLESVEAIDKRTIRVKWKDWADGDGNCCPSLSSEVVLNQDRFGNWRE